jgi:hypothetical protein
MILALDLFKKNKTLFLFLIFVKVIFFLNSYFVDDAFIIFRTAYNFGIFAEYSYNIGEKFSGVTSWLYGGSVSILSFFFNKNFIFIITFTNSVLSFISSYLIYLIFIDINKSNLNIKSNIFLLLFFLNPAICSIGTIGLETSFLIFFISSFFYNYYFQKNILNVFIFGILVILTRIELFSLFLIFLFSSFFKEKKKTILFSLIIILGLVLNLFGSFLVNGYFFPETAISKLHTLTPTDVYNFKEIIDRLLKTLVYEQSYFMGFKTKFFSYFINASFTILFLIVLLKPIVKFIATATKGNKVTNLDDLLFSISVSCIAIPLAYIFSGQIWDWYFLPFAFISILALSNFIINLNLNKFKETIIILTIILISLVNFLVKYNIAFQEHNFRSDVGKFIASNSKDNDRLFLEPAGIIPFYAKIKTVDTVGLSSKKIRDYRDNLNIDWWFDYVYKEKPEFIVDRYNILEGESKDGNLVFSKKQNIWIKENYKLLKKFNYKEYVKNFNFENIIKRFIINLGSHSNYYVYKKI